MSTVVDLNEALSRILFIARVKRNEVSRLYVELNDDRGVAEGPEEAVVRVFFDLYDCQRYCETIAEYQQIPDCDVAPVAFTGLTEVFKELAKLDGAARDTLGCAIRIDLSEMPHNEHPRTIAVLFTAFEERH